MSKKSSPILYNNLLHKMGQDFLDISVISEEKKGKIGKNVT